MTWTWTREWEGVMTMARRLGMAKAGNGWMGWKDVAGWSIDMAGMITGECKEWESCGIPGFMGEGGVMMSLQSAGAV